MPSLQVHCRISKDRTKFNFKDLHTWIDAPQKELGCDHRIERHSYNRKEAQQIKKYWEKEKGPGWGHKAVVEWLFHIAVDNLETAFIEAKKAYKGNNAFNFFKFGLIPESKFIFFDFDRLNEEELDKEFEDSYVID